MIANDKEILKAITEENDKLNNKIKEKNDEAMESSQKLINLKWNIKKTEFISYCEEKERQQDRSLMKRLENEIKESEDKWSGLDKRIEENKSILEKLKKEKESKAVELERLREIDCKNETKLKELNRVVNVLKNRNAAMKLKIKRQKQEFDDEIQHLSLQLTHSSFPGNDCP